MNAASTMRFRRGFPLLVASTTFATGLVLWSAAAFAGSAESCELRVAWDPYEPYSYALGDDSAPIGFDIEAISKVAGTIGCKLTFEKMQWGDILTALRKGEIDLAVGTGYKSDRAAWSYYSESYRKETVGLLIRRGTADEFAGADLDEVFGTGLVFGKTTDDTYHGDAVSAFEKYPGQVREPVGEDENIERLLDGEIDGFLIEVNVGSALIRHAKVSERVEFHPLAFEAGEYRFQMSRKAVSAELATRVNAAIQKLGYDGWFDRLNDEYGVRQ